MNYDEILAVLRYAGDHERQVRIVTSARTEVTGVPTSLDIHVTAHEVYLRPEASEDTEIALSLASIQEVALV
ncbi:MAG TPA: hypothetical protein VMJ30_03845 [Gemmatimonadales bacterium]|nr:hypothetical protein [Gemmatimonadales bacterium]